MTCDPWVLFDAHGCAVGALAGDFAATPDDARRLLDADDLPGGRVLQVPRPAYLLMRLGCRSHSPEPTVGRSVGDPPGS